MGRNATALPQEKRFEIIREFLPQRYSYEQIAELCNVHEQTIKNDMKFWRDSGEFEAWLMAEFFKQYDEIQAIEGGPILAFKAIVRLVEKTTASKQRIDVSKTIEHKAGPGIVDMVKGLLRDDVELPELPEEIEVDYEVLDDGSGDDPEEKGNGDDVDQEGNNGQDEKSD